MILTCPECATRYQTDAAHFAPDGRKVRCAKCSHVWFQPAPQPEPGLEEAEAATPEPQARPEPVVPRREAYAAPRVAERSDTWPKARAPILERLVLGAGWAGLAVIVVAVGWSTLHYRQPIANLWPQSSSLYAALRLPVNTRGIEIDSTTRDAHFVTENGQDVLVITGRLVNITSRPLNVPHAIRASLADHDKRELYHWSFSPGISTLRPGQTAQFSTRVPNPPSSALNIELRFAAEQTN
jgi:predicted Zn finger-like uncharacterized protein